MKIHRRIAQPMAVLLAVFVLHSGAAMASAEAGVRAAFERFVQLQNAHDARGLEAVMADSPDFLWITRGMLIWGREAAIQRFAKVHEGTWKLDPELAAMRIVPMGADVAQLHVPIVFTAGPAGQPPRTVRYFINQVWVRSGSAWQLMSIFPVPAPSP
jgi:hypothetical protein